MENREDLRVDYSNGADHPVLIQFCLNCEAPDCDGICNAWRDKYREVYDLPPVDRHRPPVNQPPAKKYSAFGEEHTITEWAKLVNLNFDTLYKRLKHGWPIEDALLKPPGTTNGRGTYVVIGDVAMTVSEWLELKGIPRTTYYMRIRDGWTPEQAIMTPPVGRGAVGRGRSKT